MDQDIVDQARIRQEQYESVREKVLRREYLTEAEKELFCSSTMSKSYMPNESIDIYECCGEYKFWSLYVTYHNNLAGGIRYFKYDPDKVRQLIKTPSDVYKYDYTDFFREVGSDEVAKDLEYLYDVADKWENVVVKRNHSDELLKEISIEAREDIKHLNKINKANPYYLPGLKPKLDKRKILLRSKYFHYKIKKILQQYKPQDFVLTLAGQEIHITPYTLVHIFSRHFSASSRPFFVDKTYHIDDISFEQLHIQLGDILSAIDNSAVAGQINPSKIVFKFNDISYIIYTSMERRFVKGKGEISYRRLNTFYPCSQSLIDKELARGCTVHKLRDDLHVYCPPKV